MFKRLISFLLAFVIPLILITGCSASDQPQVFEAQKFVEDCRILAPASQYDESKLENFEIDFIRGVFTKFGKSDFYKNMTDEEREAAYNELADVLMTYEYGNANGFIDEYMVDMSEHKVWCRLKDFTDSEIIWSMPGY